MAQLYQRIFVAIDGSSAEDEVIDRALALAHMNHAELVFGHVIDTIPSDVAGKSYEMLLEEEEAHVRQRLGDVFARIGADEAIPRYSLQLRIGRVADTLVNDLIKSCKPDLVVCGERGLSEIKYAFVGSVSKHVVREVRCDVLVVKNNDL